MLDLRVGGPVVFVHLALGPELEDVSVRQHSDRVFRVDEVRHLPKKRAARVGQSTHEMV